eukprot:TRINITY_DN1642_c1_g2_i2.p1 TRINITY_DN1642_c1_g2~~TRINITY_DN1642_c1_g2_i2.p1  ORF type:complete len:491 (-),score=119.48 TRINITY_DN1642_c1_g2_i2:90-1562(-)
MGKDFPSLLSRAERNDPSLVDFEIKSLNLIFRPHFDSGTRGLPSRPVEIIQRVAGALAHNTHVRTLKITSLGISEDDLVPLAELLQTHDFDSLCLERNRLTGGVLLPALAVRNSLRVLALCSNQRLTALEHLCALTSLKELDLRCCGLHGLLPALCPPSSLEVLLLDSNPLETLPPSFSSLVNLKHLVVRGCDLSAFPEVLLRLTQLQVLDICKNPLSNIPDGIAALTSLKDFSAQDCGLTEFCGGLTQLPQLEVLDLSTNFIQHLPGEVGNLYSLKELNLVQCGLAEVPRVLWRLTNLETLWLGSDPFEALPAGIGALQKLKTLGVCNCSLSHLPTEMQRLTQLEMLSMSGTKVTHLPLWLGSLPLLELWCSDHRFFGVAVNRSTLLTFEELAARVNADDPAAPAFRDDPMRLLRIAHMRFAPRTPLRELCVAQCAVRLGRVEQVERLPAHVQDEIVRAAGVGEGIVEIEGAPADGVRQNSPKKGCFVS